MIDVVIATAFGSGDYLRRCVESLAKKAKGELSFHISFWNINEETERVLEWAKEEYDARVIEGVQNLSKSLNMAIRNGSAPYILTCDDDAVMITDGWDELMLESLEKRRIAIGEGKLEEKRVGLVVPRVVRRNYMEVPWLPFGQGRDVLIFQKDFSIGTFTGHYDIEESASGFLERYGFNFYLFRRGDGEKAGLFDETLPTKAFVDWRFEDAIKSLGLCIYCDERVAVYHDSPRMDYVDFFMLNGKKAKPRRDWDEFV